MTVLGLDAGSSTLGEAEHLLHLVVKVLGLPGGTVGCTHFVRTGRPHVACSLAVSGPVDPAGLPEGVSAAIGESRTGPESEGAALAAAEHATGASGRLITYAGREALTGTLSVGEMLERSAIERVMVLAQTREPPRDMLIVTNDHVRPVWRDGLITLLCMPAAGGRLMPAEVPNPTPCCADHS
ncbi:hypothetical protein ABT061_41160 [Streptosporangium sp. NPDC002544]|uniref:hypothetical protein n=1 Tax=Streptosporangium sp. NPDC002544 TaxID=3154538 RepID=UPI003331C694